MPRTRAAILSTGLIAASLIFTLARSGPLNGSPAALVLTVLAQVYLPGWLLARVFGKHRHPHPIVRFVWILAGGIALPVVIGSAARLFDVPVMTYLLALHAVMLVLAWLPAGSVGDEPPWQFTRRKLPLYLTVGVACLIVVGVSYASRYRFFGFEDQTIFVSHVEWLANNPGITPNGGPLRSRQVAVNTRDTRFDTDGWTYDQAAWVWASGVSASEVVWLDLGPLFLWAVPLVVFAMAYEITRREEAAAWSTAALVLVGLVTLDNIAHFPSYVTFGRFAVFEINTLRQAAITLVLPLTLLIGFTYLRTRRVRDLLMMLLAGTALAIFHPALIMLFVISLGGTAGLSWLVNPGRRKALIRLIPLGLALVFLLVLPFVQRTNRSGFRPTTTIIREPAVQQADVATPDRGFLILPDLPLMGSTYIRNPASVFYHPVLVLVIGLGLLYGLALRHSPVVAPYVFGTTVVFLLLNFTPGLTELFDKVASSVGLLITMFLLPTALVLGYSLDSILRWLAARLRGYPTWPASAALIGTAALLLFEPIPIPNSGRDQINSHTEVQQFQRLRPEHAALMAALQTQLPANQISVVMAPADTSGAIVEDLPHTLVTGGRSAYNRAGAGDNRFYNQRNMRAPWLDSDDLTFMETYGVTHIVIRANQTRLPQLLLQPERFPLLDQVDGQWVFTRNPMIVPDEDDDLFAQMNALYADTPLPRWEPTGFEMPRPGSPETWGALADAWEDRLAHQPDDDRARLGLAFSDLMMGADEQALPVWQQLHDSYPDMPLFNEALANTYVALSQPTKAVNLLLAALDSDQPDTRVLSARALMSESFFYLLDSDQLDRVLSVTQNDAERWDFLSFFDQPDRIRQQAALLMTTGRWATASGWLDHLPLVYTSPRDLTAQAIMALAQGDIDGALARLQPATDPDWRYAKAYWHPDRWAQNHAERLYHLLTGDLAMRDGRYADAAAAYQQAVDAGADQAGRYFLAQALDASGQSAQADQVRTGLDSALELAPMLNIADSGSPFVMQPEVEQDEAAHTLTVRATFGDAQPDTGYPVETWRVEIVSPDSATRYAALDVPAQLVEDALVRDSITLPLPTDLDPLTPALVILTPMHSRTVTYPPAIVPVTLNRPASATAPADAVPLDLQFGPSITLESYTLSAENGQIDLTLYWRASEALPEDYQVFVHALDSSGTIIAQDDGAPVQNRYLTSQWRAGVTIADPHPIALDPLPEHFRLSLGLYRLSDGTRLPITPPDDRVQDDSVLIDR